ncbi:MAG: YhfC family glutamic-type intramembrane protease [Candidatus Nezhaarchaeota archaeon]|nr:YhfC family glutamic-type intramembrane protease [Candidatus Nezhaarchaeota archaeon]
MGAQEAAIPIAISLAPALVALFKASGTRATAWIIAALGGGGWLVALVLRLPVLMAVPLSGIVYGYFSSAMAGLFEETARSMLLRLDLVRRLSLRGAAALGLGWGLTEALLVYAIPAGLAAAAGRYGWTDLLPGALERNSALLIHLSLAMLLSWDPRSLKLLAASIVIHSAANSVAVTSLYLLRDVWLVELIIALFSAATFTAITACTLKRFKPPAGQAR